VDLFLFVGRLPLMARRTVDMYGMFLIHFHYFVQALSDIRTATPTRLLLIIKTYTFLQDAITS
jgi:hypothetical protein